MIANTFIKNGIPTISPRDVESLKDVTLIDVRNPDEYVGELGHIKGARLITLGSELDNFLATENKKSALVFVCRSGARSGKATSQALALGFENIYNMEGGMLAWNSHSLPITK